MRREPGAWYSPGAGDVASYNVSHVTDDFPLTTPNPNHNADYYAALDYPVELSRRDDDGESYWLCEAPDLPGCVADGETPDEAIESLDEAKRLWVEARLEHGCRVPEPTTTMGGLDRW